jgi:hypothetical protein
MPAPLTTRDPHQARPTARPVNDEDELIGHLERDQYVAVASLPVARAALGRRTRMALWALRVFALLVSAMVIYTFVTQLD